jgi:aminobenzoyl-glutamate utilization protein A
MIEAGVVDGVDRMLAIHVSGGEPTSKVMGSSTGGMATQKLLVTFDGVAAHASGAPEHGRNALAAAAMATLGILGLPRFHVADTRLNVGTLHAGDNVNIIPAHAVLTCEARAADDEVLLDLAARVRRVIEGAAAAYGVDSAVQVTGQAPTLAPDEGLIDLVVAAAGEVGGVASVARTVRQAGSDDANTMIRLVQSRGGTGAYVRVGASSPAPHHNPFFDVEEAAIGTGIDVLEQLLRRG